MGDVISPWPPAHQHAAAVGARALTTALLMALAVGSMLVVVGAHDQHHPHPAWVVIEYTLGTLLLLAALAGAVAVAAWSAWQQIAGPPSD